METVITIWNFLTMAVITAYGLTMLVRAEKSGKELKTEVLFRGCLILLGIGVSGMLIIAVIASLI